MPQPIRVLLLEDNPSDARLVARELHSAGFEAAFERVDSEQAFVQELGKHWDLILADYSLPQFDAPRALQHLRDRHLDIPFIIVSGTIDEEVAVAALKGGAVDFVLKDRLGRLGQAVAQALEQRRLREAQRRAEESLYERTQLIMLTADVGVALNRTDSLRDMLQNCAQSVVDNLDAALVRIWTMNHERDELEMQASAGLYTHVNGQHGRIRVGQFKVGSIARDRRTHLSNDIANDPLISDPAWAARERMQAFAGYPLIVADRVAGVFVMFARRQVSPSVLDALAAIANQIAAGIERKRVEERLQFTQFTIDRLATPVFWADAGGNFFHVNDAACQLTGYERESLVKMSVWHINPEIPPERWNTVWSDLRSRGKLATESLLRCQDGTEIPIGVSSSLLRNEDQEFSCTFIQDLRDLHDARERERRLAAERDTLLRRLQLQIARMPLAYVLFDDQFRIIDWNPAAEKIYGYRKDEVLGMAPPFEKILPATGRANVDKLLARLRSGDMGAHMVNENVTREGRSIVCEWMNTPLENDDGQFAGALCLVQDVTERMRLEEQFRQAQKMEAVGKLAGGVAHDFNNLLTVILGYSDILMESLREGDPLRELVEQVHKAGSRAAGLTRQLLAFSRKQMLVPIVLDLNSLISDMEKMLSRLIGEDIELRIEPDPQLWPVRVDPGQMEQVIMNLVVNSRDAMPQGGRLTIRTGNAVWNQSETQDKTQMHPGEYAVITVADSGCGMDRSTQSRIFEPFFSTKGEQGTGLGLATVYGIIRQSGGHIAVDSEPGQGTTFSLYLPREREPSSSLSGRTDHRSRLDGKETVLLVEDEDGVRKLARATLQRHGYKVLEARHGGEALLICEQFDGHIHLVATDIVMPHMSGQQLAERLLKLRPNLRVLFLSGYMDDTVVRHGMLSQDTPFLQKPYTPDILAAKVRETLDGGRLW